MGGGFSAAFMPGHDDVTQSIFKNSELLNVLVDDIDFENDKDLDPNLAELAVLVAACFEQLFDRNRIADFGQETQKYCEAVIFGMQSLWRILDRNDDLATEVFVQAFQQLFGVQNSWELSEKFLMYRTLAWYKFLGEADKALFDLLIQSLMEAVEQAEPKVSMIDVQPEDNGAGIGWHLMSRQGSQTPFTVASSRTASMAESERSARSGAIDYEKATEQDEISEFIDQLKNTDSSLRFEAIKYKLTIAFFGGLKRYQNATKEDRVLFEAILKTVKHLLDDNNLFKGSARNNPAKAYRVVKALLELSMLERKEGEPFLHNVGLALTNQGHGQKSELYQALAERRGVMGCFARAFSIESDSSASLNPLTQAAKTYLREHGCASAAELADVSLRANPAF